MTDTSTNFANSWADAFDIVKAEAPTAAQRHIAQTSSALIRAITKERDELHAALKALLTPQTPAAFAAAMQHARALVEGKGNE